MWNILKILSIFYHLIPTLNTTDQYNETSRIHIRIYVFPIENFLLSFYFIQYPRLVLHISPSKRISRTLHFHAVHASLLHLSPHLSNRPAPFISFAYIVSLPLPLRPLKRWEHRQVSRL